MGERFIEPTGLMAAIVASARVRAAAITHATEVKLEQVAAARCPRGEAFVAALSRPGINVIAECKRRSPLKGVLRDPYHAADIAAGYERAGAAAISVLTEPEFFDGSLDDLQEVRAEVAVPVLRKDFIVHERQLLEARAAGADAVLLIVAALCDDELRRLVYAAHGLGLAALVEVHTAGEMARALDAEVRVVGVNARDLRTMKVASERVEELARFVPPDRVAVAESGIRSRAAIDRLREVGYHAFLIGERLVTSEQPEAALAALLKGTPCS